MPKWPQKPPPTPPLEAQRTVLLWTIATLTSLGAQLVAGACALLSPLLGDDGALQTLLRLLLVAAALCGLAVLVMFPYVVRSTSPALPRAVLAIAGVIAVAPLLILGWLLLR